MSVQTEADVHLQKAREHVASAVTDLSFIVVEQCPGKDDLKPERYQAVTGSLMALLGIREKL